MCPRNIKFIVHICVYLECIYVYIWSSAEVGKVGNECASGKHNGGGMKISVDS